jgi:hypothetical protein
MNFYQFTFPFDAGKPYGSAGPSVVIENPRMVRAIKALLKAPCKREDLDRIAGASNSPELVACLRRRGLRIPCMMVEGVDRDGVKVKYGVYSFDEQDRQTIHTWTILAARNE